MASTSNLSVHGTEMEGIINEPNTHQIEEPAEDTITGFTPPTCREGTTTRRVVVFGLPCDQAYFGRGKKARDQWVEDSERTLKRKGKELCMFTPKSPEVGYCHFLVSVKICYHVIVVDENAIVDITGAAVPVDDDNLPFKKNKILWEAADSLEAFSLIPHKPHFRPLESYREIEREGKALSLMILFDKITKKTLTLDREAPREDIENDLSLLTELETHGFDVLKLKNVLNGILLFKEQLEDVENVTKKNKMRLTQFDLNKCKSKEKRIKMQDEITKLMEEDRLNDLGEKKSGDDIASDKLAITKYEDEITRIGIEITELVASPFY